MLLREKKCRARGDPSNNVLLGSSGFDDGELAEEDEYKKNRMLNLLLAFLFPILGRERESR